LGVRVNALCPGFIRTPLNDAIAAGQAGDFQERYAAERIPLGRSGRPAGGDVARAGIAPAAHLEFSLGLGYFKIAVVAEGIHARHLRGMTRSDGFRQIGEAVALAITGWLSGV
jgi:NAD(P)-dependent dehydrogenase (short-subunit alcohol dehydrogenase family)